MPVAYHRSLSSPRHIRTLLYSMFLLICLVWTYQYCRYIRTNGLLHKALVVRPHNCLSPRANAQFGINVTDMVADGLFVKMQFRSNLGVVPPPRQQAQDLLLPCGQGLSDGLLRLPPRQLDQADGQRKQWSHAGLLSRRHDAVHVSASVINESDVRGAGQVTGCGGGESGACSVTKI